MVKSFEEFIKEEKEIAPILIPVDLNHGSHSVPKVVVKPILIPVDPTHGSHSRKRTRLKEEHEDGVKIHSTHEWQHKNENEHLGDEAFDIGKKIQLPREKFEKHPSSDGLVSYTNSSHGLNHHLLEKAKGKLKPVEDPDSYDGKYQVKERAYHEKQTVKLDHALSHSKLGHDLHVYHGTRRFNPGELASQHPKRLIRSAAYMSTSIDKGTAHSFSGQEDGGHIIHIRLKKGEQAHYMGSNSSYPSEHEAILPRDTALKIHPEPTHLSNGVKVWHADIHHSPEDLIKRKTRKVVSTVREKTAGIKDKIDSAKDTYTKKQVSPELHHFKQHKWKMADNFGVYDNVEKFHKDLQGGKYPRGYHNGDDNNHGNPYVGTPPKDIKTKIKDKVEAVKKKADTVKQAFDKYKANPDSAVKHHYKQHKWTYSVKGLHNLNAVTGFHKSLINPKKAKEKQDD